MALRSLKFKIPILFRIEKNLANKVSEIFKEKKIHNKRFVVISGSTESKKIAKKLDFKNSVLNIEVKSNSFAEVERIGKKLSQEKISFIIGVGGGKVLDVVKRVSYEMDIPHIGVPTIISNDGLISPIAVLKDSNGLTNSIKASEPAGILIDLSILKKNDSKYIQSAAGDIISNISSTNDWIVAKNEDNEKIIDISYHLSRISAKSCIYTNNADFQSIRFIKTIIQGQFNSGIAMQIAGSSRPCSGSEHLISHAIDFLGVGKNNVLHGYQVGSISLFCIFLQNKLEKELFYFSQKINLEFEWKSFLIDSSEEKLIEIFKTSRNMRKNRYTVLNKYTNEELVEKYNEYVKYCNTLI